MNNMEKQIRPAVEADIAEITAIYASSVREGTGSFEITPPDEAEMTRRFAALSAQDYPFLVCEAELGRKRQILGYAYAGPYNTREGFRYVVEDSIYIRSAAQGKGVGKLLLKALMEAAKARGFIKMIAVIGDSHNASSVRLHESMGFRHCGTLPEIGHKFDRWLDVVFMLREL